MNKQITIYIAGFLCSIMSLSAHAIPIPAASDWSTDISDVAVRGLSGPSNTAITDISGGVQLHYDAPSGGRGRGTDQRQYDFTTSVTAGGILDFDIAFSAETGFFFNEIFLGVIQNDVLVQTLIPFTSRAASTVNRTFNNINLTLAAGDSWGVRVRAGNFTACCGVSGDITVTGDFTPAGVPEPSSGLLALLAIGLLIVVRKKHPPVTRH